MNKSVNKYNHQQININGASTHLIEYGNKEKQPVLFLHGYPENWLAFEEVMEYLKDDYRLLAIDMPGIGESAPIPSGDKSVIAFHIHELIQSLGLENLIVVGHDMGGMVAYSLIRQFPQKIARVVIMNTAIPGIKPWEEVKRNPYIWHFAFFSIPELPEKLLSGNHRELFNYFYNAIAANKNAIDDKKKEFYIKAYESEISLKTSLGWYRSFFQDDKDNTRHSSVDIPVLYLNFGDIKPYLEGFKESGILNIVGKKISNSGHFAPEEAPEEVAKTIDLFIQDRINIPQDAAQF